MSRAILLAFLYGAAMRQRSMLDQANFVKSTARMLREMLIMLRLLGRSGRRNLLYEANIL